MFTYEDAVRISKKENRSRTLVSIKPWAQRKFLNRCFGAANMFEVCRETEKAILLVAVDTRDPYEAEWVPKSAVVENEF